MKPTDPVRFRVGDIVEAQLNATIIPIAKGRFIMKMHLRALALLFPRPYKASFATSQSLLYSDKLFSDQKQWFSNCTTA